MSDILKIDTGAAAAQLVRETRVNPLPLYDGTLQMLGDEIPEYTEKLPNAEMNVLVEQLKMTMKKFGGIGLSANQCNVFERVFVIGTDQFQIVCINPKIIAHSEEMVKDKEGCLSYPGLFITVPRYSWIDVEFTTEKGEVKQMHMEGITARCFQHELDHMNGIRYTDKVGPVALRLAKQKQEKVIKKTQRRMKNKNAVFV